MAKETLGYSSCSAAIRALAGGGLTLEEIAPKVGLARADVKVHLGYRGGAFYPKRPGRYWVDRDGQLHPCRGEKIEVVASVTIRAIELPAAEKPKRRAKAKSSVSGCAPHANGSETQDETGATTAVARTGKAEAQGRSVADSLPQPDSAEQLPMLKQPAPRPSQPVVHNKPNGAAPRLADDRVALIASAALRAKHDVKAKTFVRVAPVERPRVELPPKPKSSDGFEVAPGDDPGSAPTAWCDQCEVRRTRGQARVCSRRFCKLRDRVDA